MTIHQIDTPVFSAISSFSMGTDGSMSVTYSIGTGALTDNQVTDFQPLITEYKYLDPQQAQAILFAPLTKECIGKPFNEVITNRIYNYMIENGMIRA